MSSRSVRRSVQGFTLIELVVAMVVLAILASIAYPAYQTYSLRGQVVSATNGLASVSANMERYFQDNRTYVATGGFQPPCSTAATYGNFTVSCTSAPTATTYTITAVGTGVVAGFTYQIDQDGVKSSVVSAPAPSSWIKACPSTWETSAGQC